MLLNKKITFAALVWVALLALSECVNIPQKTLEEM